MAPSPNRKFDRDVLAKDLARLLDMLADAELQHGHHRAAEHLARRAATMKAISGGDAR